MPRKKKDSFISKDRTYHQINGRSASLMLRTKHDSRNPLYYVDDSGDRPVQRPLRYCTNQASPFLDEQEGEAIVGQVNLIEGTLQVPASNRTLQEFLELTPENGIVFQEFDPEEKAEKELSKEEELFKAKSFIFNAKPSDLVAIAKVIDGNKVDKLSPSEVKQSLITKANNKPQMIIDLFEDDDLKELVLASEALNNGILEIKGDKLMNKGNVVFEIPYGKEPKNVLKDYFKTAEGAKLKAYLKKVIK